MLGPDSTVLTALLVAGSVALLVAAIRLRPIAVKVLCGSLSIVVAMVGGIAAVNYYYGYYTSWGQLAADLQGTSGNLGVITTNADTPAAGSGRLALVDLPGKLSGYDRRGLVYLPPQYSQAKYSKVRFPVVELFHGSPGTPLAWDTVLKIGQVADTLMAKHLIGPMVLVMPAINGAGHDYQDCVNGPAVKDDTYLTQDVRADVLARYRVSGDAYEWGTAGYSSGGFCAANLALRHRSSFGAAAVINGYFQAANGPAAGALSNNQSLEAANSPLSLAERLTAGAGPVPAFWIAAGTHDRADYAPASVFAAAINRLEQAPFVKLNAGDTANAWQAALPVALTWLWQQLAPPDLRVLFPVRAQGATPISLPVAPVKHHPSVPCTHGVIKPTCHVPAHGKGKAPSGQLAAS